MTFLLHAKLAADSKFSQTKLTPLTSYHFVAYILILVIQSK